MPKRNRRTYVLIFCISIACSSSQNGFREFSPVSFKEARIDKTQLNYLKQEKLKANKESLYQFEKIQKQIESKQTIEAKAINNLFKNLRVHYSIDSVYHHVLKFSQKDSFTRACWENIMKSADFYSTTFQSNKKIRCIINRGDIASHIPENWLYKTQQFLWNNENIERAKACGLNIESFRYSRLDFLSKEYSDYITEAIYETAGFCSEITSRLFHEFRSKEKSDKISTYLSGKLQKWDIICKKTSENLTDSFIPGFFGHVGIYMGNGIVAESVQEGVVYSHLNEFTNTNSSYLVVRPTGLTSSQIELMENHLNAQIGKNFDFNFDVESPDQLICTELVYLVFDQINWHSERIFWREIIYPDFIVKTALENSNLGIPLFVNDEYLIHNPNSKFITDLLKEG